MTFDTHGQITNVVPSCTQSIDSKNAVASMPFVNPCSGVPGTVTETFKNEIFHVTVNGAGDVWITSTSTGAVTFAPVDPGQPSYSGHIETWFGDSLNRNNAVLHDVTNATLTGTDGSTVTLHLVGHVSFNAGGVETSFSITSVGCG